MKPKKPTKRAPKPKVYSVTFKVRTTATAKAVKYESDIYVQEAVRWLEAVFCDASLVMEPHVEEVGTR